MQPEALATYVPDEPNRFIGREGELASLRDALGRTRSLTLCGPGGIGKTRLAMRLLGTVSADYPDGVWVVELGDLWEPALIVSRMASQLGIDGEAGQPLLDTLAAALEPRQALVLLDNCEHLVDACAGLCQRLLAACPEVRILATSQEPLRIPQESVWQVAPLNVPPAGLPGRLPLAGYEAVQLFAERAAAARPGFAVTERNAMAVAGICRALDGVPLAIELAAARVNVLSAEQIAARLDDRFTLLGRADRTSPPRQRTLRATIDWSHDLLSPAEQVLVRRLSVFAGWSLEMAEYVCADDRLPAEQIIDASAGLVDKSLVVVEPEVVLGQARYRLLDSVRAYAAQRLAAAGESAAIQLRLRDYSLGFAEQATAEAMGEIPAAWAATVDVFRRYDVDAGNLRQVLSWCMNTADVVTGLRLCTAMRPVWIVRGQHAEGEEWFGRFLALDRTGLPPAVLGAALIGRAQLTVPDEPAAAQAWAREGLELCRAAGQRPWTATALNLLAEVDLHAGRLAEAQRCAAEALEVARAAGNAWNEGYALGTQGTLAAVNGQLREAGRLGEAALAVMRGIDQQWGVARTLLGLGALAQLRGDPAGALDCYREALPVLREIDSRPDIARCLAGIARIALGQGDLGTAREHLAESLRLSRLTGSRIGVARGLEAFAALAGREGEAALAVQLTGAASALRAAAGRPPLAQRRIQRRLDAARSLGEDAVAGLWRQGEELTAEAAVALALGAAAGARRGGTVTPLRRVAAESTLTPREQQIAGLIAGGYSNRAIGAELVISPATAARHVANILGKLGFSSRAQIAAWAAGNASIQPPAAHERGSFIP